MDRKSYSWNSQDYARHSSAQFAWARELIDKLDLKGAESLLDIGCGDGKVSAAIAGTLGEGNVTAIDSSESMIALARKTYPGLSHPNLSFVLKDVLDMEFEGQFDLVFSNAALHWVKDHEKVLTRTARALKRSGRLLFQMGGYGNASTIIEAVDELISTPAWSSYFGNFGFPYGFYRPEEYKGWLSGTGFEERRIELIEKDMVQVGKSGLEGWIRTTWLPYTQRVPDRLRDEFISEIADTYLSRYPLDEQGLAHVAMVRLEVEAVKP